MVRADVAYLIGEMPAEHGVFDKPEETKRMVYVVVKSVGQAEMYNALNLGLVPTYVFELSDYSEYQGEKILEYNGIRYRVLRTYVKDMTIEITVVNP